MCQGVRESHWSTYLLGVYICEFYLWVCALVRQCGGGGCSVEVRRYRKFSSIKESIYYTGRVLVFPFSLDVLPIPHGLAGSSAARLRGYQPASQPAGWLN